MFDPSSTSSRLQGSVLSSTAGGVIYLLFMLLPVTDDSTDSADTLRFTVTYGSNAHSHRYIRTMHVRLV